MAEPDMRFGVALCARDIMQKRVLTVGPAMRLPELVDFLIQNRVSGVPVVDGGRCVGIVSRSDLVRSVSLERSLAGVLDEAFGQEEFAPGEAPEPVTGRTSVLTDLQNRKVRDIMVPEPLSVSPDTPVQEIARLLVSNHMHRVLVTDGAKLIGLISSLDVVRIVADGGE